MTATKINLTERIESRLTTLNVGRIASLWDLLVWRVSETKWVIGHNSISINDHGVSLEEAIEKFALLLD